MDNYNNLHNNQRYRHGAVHSDVHADHLAQFVRSRGGRLLILRIRAHYNSQGMRQQTRRSMQGE